MNHLTILAVVAVLSQAPERTFGNPYGYYGAYSRTRRDPTAWDTGYHGMVQPNHIPVVPNAMGGLPTYGGHIDNQGVGLGGAYGQDTGMYGMGQYGTMDRNSMMGRLDSTSRHSSMGGHQSADLNGYQQQPYPDQIGGGSDTIGDSQAPDECRGVACQSLLNCMNVTVNDTKCCPKCIQYGCICVGYQAYDCEKNGFSDGMLPEGRSYTVAEGTTVCSCPPGGGSITCSFHDRSSSRCPELPLNCVESFVRDIDGCEECTTVGCISETGTKVKARTALDKPPCTTCYCPPEGGEMLCGVRETCEEKLKQQGSRALAMESSIRGINSMGNSMESKLYGDYKGYGAYGDYSNQYAQNPGVGGGAAVVPPIMPLTTGTESEKGGENKKAGDAEGQEVGSNVNGLNSYGSYPQQGYNTGYQGSYRQYNPYQQNVYGADYPGYGGNYGYNGGYSQGGTGYLQQKVDQTKSTDTSKDISGENKQTEVDPASSHQRPDEYDGMYQTGGLGQYGPHSYVPPPMSGYPSYPGQVTEEDKDGQGEKSEGNSDAGRGGTGSQNQGYGYGGYGQGGYYRPDAFGQYNGYGQYKQKMSAIDPATNKEGGGAVEKSNIAASGKNQPGSQEQRGYGGGFNQYVGSYDPYYAAQYAYHQEQIPGKQSSDSLNPPSDVKTENKQTQQEAEINGNRGKHQANYPYYPYDQGASYPAYPSQSGSQYQPVNPTLTKPGASGGIDAQAERATPNPREPADKNKHSRAEAFGSRKIRDNLNTINKGRFAHEKAVRTTPTPTATTSPKPTTATTNTTRATTQGKRSGTNNQVTFETVLERCCSRGRQWAEQHDTCGGISISPGTYSRICSVAQEKCCLEAKDQQYCQGGMDTARSRAACNIPANLENTCGANEFKTCCDCCEMGLKALQLGLTCDVQIFGEPCNKAYVECCTRSEGDRPIVPEPTSTMTAKDTKTTLPPETPEASGPRCAADNNCRQVCEDTSDGMICSCRKGYRLHKNKRDCVDVNECVLNTHTCTEHQICLNREGSFFCQRRISCGTGYELTERNTCEDIDECALNIHDCLPNTDCDNIRGSYRCIPKLCDAGFITDATGRCIDIDECRTGYYVCPKGASCVNKEGSYDCECPLGLAPNSANDMCEDVDECTSGIANCAEGATCVNTIGSFACRNPKLRCAPGYRPNDDTKTCVDIDECTTGTHTCKSGSTCINENGGFRCQDPLVCPKGLKPDEDGKICLDINECEDPARHRCDVGGRCLNLAGTFKCICDSGYENALSDEGVPTCKDVDECATSVGESCNYKCRNLPGSYECYCPEGFALGNSGQSCEDIDECAQRESPCDGGETCFNTKGSHKCVSLACPDGYAKTSNTRCGRRSCRNKPRSCLKQPKQISFHNISLTNGTIREKPLFRMSLARTHPTDRYEFLITSGNEDGSFKIRSSTRNKRPTGVIYTAEKLVGPKDYVIDLSLKLNRGRRRSTFVSRLYIFVSEYSVQNM